MKRENVSSGSKWEPMVGYSRAVRMGNMVFVAGTTANSSDADAYTQTKEILQRIEVALQQVGAGLNDVVQTHMFVTDISQWEEYGRAHGEVFGAIRPVTSMIEVKQLIDPKLKIEMEAIAMVGDAH